MITIMVAFTSGDIDDRETFGVYGAMLESVVTSTVGAPSALYVGQAEVPTGAVEASGLMVTYAPNLARLDDLTDGLTAVSAMFGQPFVAVSLANVEFIGTNAPFGLSDPVVETTTDALDPWREVDDELDALGRDLAAIYSGSDDPDEAEALAYLGALLEASQPAPSWLDDDDLPESD